MSYLIGVKPPPPKVVSHQHELDADDCGARKKRVADMTKIA
jgi:hypothetical protein